MLDIWLDALAEAGVDEVLVNTPPPRPGWSRAHLAARGRAPGVRLVHEPELLGSAGTLLANRDFVAGEDMFLAVNADNLTDFDLRVLVDAHRARGHAGHADRVPRPASRRACGIVEVVGRRRRRLRREAGAAAQRPRERGHVRLPPRRARPRSTAPPPHDIGFHLLPRLVGRARRWRIGDSFFARHRHPGGARARPRRVAIEVRS